MGCFILININCSCDCKYQIDGKCYLENVLKPFKDRILFAKKTTIYDTDSGYEYVCFKVVTSDNEDYNYLVLPYFIKGTMYKGMKIDKNYSLEELGLFMGDDE